MSISLEDTQNGPDKLRVPPEIAARQKWSSFFFWGVLIVLIGVAIATRLYHLDAPFDRDSYDEGVYWQSLRSMLAGQGLYQSTFYSQPPVFLLSVFPVFALFGGSIWAARFGIVLISLLGFLGAGLIGKTLAGRTGVLAAVLLLLVNPLYLAESQILQADGPAVALTLLALGLALLWWRQPTGWRGTCWAALTGITLILSIFCKLLCATTLVPIALLMLARCWQTYRHPTDAGRLRWLPILVGIGSALVTVLLVVLPFLASWQAAWDQVVTFHEVAQKVIDDPLHDRLRLIQPTLFSFLALTAFFGTVTALARRDWLVLSLLAWLLATFALLLHQVPLLAHHMVALVPPLLALSILGITRPAGAKLLIPRLNVEIAPGRLRALILALILVTLVFNTYQDIQDYTAANTTLASQTVQQEMQIANDLRQSITPDQWVITDGQFIAGLAGRSTPPALVDTSTVRTTTGYVTLSEIEQAASDPHVHAVLFFSSRLMSLPQLAGFYDWVGQHYHLLRSYGPGKELWVR